MRHSLFPFLFFALFLAAFAGCQKEEDPQQTEDPRASLAFETVLLNQGQEIAIGDTLMLSNGHLFNLKKFKLYLSHITLIDEVGRREQLREVVLVDVGDENTGAFNLRLPKAKYASMEMGLGLDSVLNNSDPTAFDNDHPLSSWQQTYWTMLKYRFAILEGRSNPNGSFDPASDILHAYHPGTDPLFRTLQKNLSLDLDQFNQGKIQLRIDLDDLFNHPPAIDMVNEPQTHSEPIDIETARKMMNNLQATAQVTADVAVGIAN